MKVLKFGGSSVSAPERVKSVGLIIAQSQREIGKIAVVVSAFGGVTDTLIEIGKTAATGQSTYQSTLSALQERHLEALRALIPAKDQTNALLQLKNWFNELEDVLKGLLLVCELSKRTLDFVMSFGELFSAFILAEHLKSQNIAAEFLDARTIIKTDNVYGGAHVDFTKSGKLINDHFKSASAIQIVTGFIAATDDNDTVTLGRGGSDYTASILGACLGSQEIEIWTDVDGMLTADPRKVKKAFPQSVITYEETMELAHFGAKVIYPPTMQPALDKKIPVRIRNTFNPTYGGTLVTHKSDESKNVVTGISSIEKVALLRVEGSGLIGVAGISMRLFGALAKSEISVILITQASSEHTICLAVKPEEADAAKRHIEEEFSQEITLNAVKPVIVEADVSIISVVGENMRRSPGIAGRIFSALGRNGVNVIAIAQGSSELNISAVVSRNQEVKALNALHEELFFPDTKVINVFLVGVGLIGNKLLEQFSLHAEQLQKTHQHEIRIVGVANSRKMTFNPDGVPFETCRTILADKSEGGSVAEFVQQMKALNLPNSVFVDCTASENVVEHYADVLQSSISIVTPNKKAQSGALDRYRTVKRAAARRGIKFLYETSVGAGLPVINTLTDLLKSGDTVIKIEAVLSGTLSFIFNSWGEGKKFSEIVREAKQKGYTEPDPRDDLSGLDVARKILILARETGAELNLENVEVESLVSKTCADATSVDEFFTRLEKEDLAFEERRKKISAGGGRLSYIASFEDGKAAVKLQAIDSSHPFFRLSGSDNIVCYTTQRYSDRPLVVQGPGAGPDVTAAGVFADLIRIG